MTRGMSNPYVVWLNDADPTATGLLGGKFASLAEMTAAGFAVPPGFTVTTAAFDRFMAQPGLQEEAAKVRLVDPGDLSALEDASQRVTAEIEQADFPEELSEAVRDAYRSLETDAGEEGPPVAVRSSGVAEDLHGASFAGQYETFLWIIGADEVLRHVRRCWTGLFSPRVLTYHVQGDQAASAPPSMAVGVQHMVPARAAGVMFTLDPVNGDRSKVVIEAAWGLGEAVVGGEVTPDRYRIDKVTLDVIMREISVKEVEYGFSPAKRGVEVRAVPEDRKAASALTDAQALELASLGKRIERHRGAPMDIEWAVDERDRIHVLQVRPETVWSQKGKEPLAPKADSAVEQVLARFMASVGTPPAPTEERGE